MRRVNDHLSGAMAPVLRDLEAAGMPLPRVEPANWQTFQPSESAHLRSADGSGVGVWVDTSLDEAEQVVMVAEQVQEWAIEELPGRHLPANWPPCEEHPLDHPLRRNSTAAWRSGHARRRTGQRARSATCRAATGWR